MNRRDFFKYALGVVGMGLLVGGVAPPQDTKLTRIYPFAPSGFGDAVLDLEPLTNGIPDHTHDIPLYPSPFALSDDVIPMRDVIRRHAIYVGERG